MDTQRDWQTQADIDGIIRKLERRGVHFSKTRKEADASRMSVVGIDTLGKLDFLNRNGYSVALPAVNKNPASGYRGLESPLPRRKRFSLLDLLRI